MKSHFPKKNRSSAIYADLPAKYDINKTLGIHEICVELACNCVSEALPKKDKPNASER